MNIMSSTKPYRVAPEIRDKIKPLYKMDNWHGLLAWIEDALIIGLAIFMAYSVSYYFYPLALIIIGSRQRALATLVHESAHRRLAKNAFLNNILGTFFSGYFIFQKMSAYKNSHIAHHHAHFGDKDKDPDYLYALKEGLYGKKLTAKIFIKKYIIYPFFLTKIPSYINALIFDRLLESKNKKETVILISFWITLISLSIIGGFFDLLLLFWIIPYLTVFQIIGWFIELAEHFPLMENRYFLYMSRNRHSHGVEKFLTAMHNENYHLVHHINPGIPFWNMKKAHHLYMTDKDYAEWDKQTGGIFFSDNNRPSIIKSIINILRQQKNGMPI
jgi:fatty acid desaturase